MLKNVFSNILRQPAPISIFFRQAHLPKFLKHNHDPTPAAKQDILKALQASNVKTWEDWNGIKENIYACLRDANPNNIDSIMLTSCITNKKYEIALNYLGHLKERKVEMNLATMGKIFKLYFCMYTDKQFNENIDKEILELYEYVKKKYDILDSITNEHMIMALSVTAAWKKCLDILEEVKVSTLPSTGAYCSIIIAAFRNDDPCAWDLLSELIDGKRVPIDECYLVYIQECEKKDDALERMDKLLEFLGNYDIVSSSVVVDRIKQFYSSRKNKSVYVKIATSGLCSGCLNKLSRIELTEEEFNSLKDAFFKRVIVGKDVFTNTTPEELAKFNELVNKNIKYDVVIDGLNVAYSSGTKPSVVVNAHYVSSVVRHFAQENKKVLVFGRSHMLKYPWKYLKFIKENAEMFLIQNVSKDDPYLLYCALNSGPKTIVVSRDLMRSHLYLLKDVHLKRLFNRWFSQSQHQLKRVTDLGRVVLTPPLSYVQTAQKVDKTWHVPYKTEDNLIRWLCVQT